MRPPRVRVMSFSPIVEFLPIFYYPLDFAGGKVRTQCFKGFKPYRYCTVVPANLVCSISSTFIHLVRTFRLIPFGSPGRVSFLPYAYCGHYPQFDDRKGSALFNSLRTRVCRIMRADSHTYALSDVTYIKIVNTSCKRVQCSNATATATSCTACRAASAAAPRHHVFPPTQSASSLPSPSPSTAAAPPPSPAPSHTNVESPNWQYSFKCAYLWSQHMSELSKACEHA